MKQIITLTALCIFSMGVFAQDDHSHSVKTETSVVKPADDQSLTIAQTEHDFGKIPQGKPVTYVFEVTNTGKTPLTLDNVQASCGCTTPVWDKEHPIEAGKTGKITVGYNAAAEGVFTKTINITYNSTQSKQLIIKGEVWKTPAVSAPVNAGLNDLKN
jgi:hypothetical protein